MLSAAASLGMILLWDVDGGLTQIDKYLYSSEDYIKVGLAAPAGWGFSCSGAQQFLPVPHKVHAFFTSVKLGAW